MLGSHRIIVSIVFVACWTKPALAAPRDPEPRNQPAVDFFEKKIRPVLVRRCYQCHSTKAKEIKGGLLLDNRISSRRGGDSGRAVVPGDIGKSLLVAALRYDQDSLQMPPDGKLPDAVVADFVKWIKSGAVDPRAAAAPAGGRPEVELDVARKFWSFRPHGEVAVPDVHDQHWPRNAVDRFVLSSLETAKLAPSIATDRFTLLRRATFDLIGLPPTAADLKQRGLLDDTLAIWGGEFGRTPTAEGQDGRDHNPHGFTWWMAGAGLKPDFSYGQTDDYGYYAVQDKVHMHDMHATILHLLGLDHERLVYRFAGRDFRLTDVYGSVVRDIIG